MICLTPPENNEDDLEVVYRPVFREVGPPLFIIQGQVAGKRAEEGWQGGEQHGGVHNSRSLPRKYRDTTVF